MKRHSITMTEINNYFNVINSDGKAEEMSKVEVIQRLQNILNWCNNNQAYEDAEALEIAIAVIKNKEG